MIKVIIFDAGGVIVDCKPILNKFIRIFKPKNLDLFWEEINLKAILMCRGEMSEKDYWKEIAKSIGVKDMSKIPDNLWTKDYDKLTHIDKDVLNLIDKLRKNYKTALISNTFAPHANINRKRGLFDHFDVTILSHEVKLTKENKDIFLIALKKLKVKAEECIFIDDIQKFIDTANSLGMKGILFKNLTQLKKELEQLRISID